MLQPRRSPFALVLVLLTFTAIAQADKVEYLHTDIFGNVVAVTDENGNVIERRVYEPYGLPETPIQDGPGFTGHDMDGESGLIYMQQRYYDPEVGQFLSPDPMAVDFATAYNFNRYAYAANSPYRYTDPDGREAACLYTATVCGMQEMTPELREAQRTIAGGMAATAGTIALLSPDPTDFVIGAAIGRVALRLNASRGFTQAGRYIRATFDNIVSTGGRSGRRTIQGDGRGGENGANKLFNELTGGQSIPSRGGGQLGSLGDGSRVHISGRTLADGTKETSVRISRERTGSHIRDNIKIRFKDR